MVFQLSRVFVFGFLSICLPSHESKKRPTAVPKAGSSSALVPTLCVAIRHPTYVARLLALTLARQRDYNGRSL